MKHYSNMARQAGMTLIELTVVLLVLIGLAGLMIPYVGGFVDKTHNSVNADSLGAVNSAIQRYEVQFMGYPDGMDSLIEADNTIYDYMMNSGLYTPHQLTVNEAKSLTSVGIDNAYEMDVNAANATFLATTNNTIAMQTGNYVAVIKCDMLMSGGGCMGGDWDTGGATQDNRAKALFNGKPADTVNNYYVAFGVGTNSQMIGKTISEAPVHFAKRAENVAHAKYNRILAVFEVPKNTAADAGKKAKFMGTVMPMSMLMGLGQGLSAEYETMAE
ncbi:MAG: hypothetical protein Kow0065_03870 [Methylomicrobium sp.]